jgi:hypothetical protein
MENNKSLCLSTFLDARFKMTFLRSDMRNKIKQYALEALKQCQMEVRGNSLDDISTGYASFNSTEDQETISFTMTFSSSLDELASAKMDSVQNEGTEETSPCVNSKKKQSSKKKEEEEDVLFSLALKN